MLDSTDREPSTNDRSKQDVGVSSGATSKETLNDLEENEANVGSSSSGADPEPSPDGAFDESKETGPI